MPGILTRLHALIDLPAAWSLGADPLANPFGLVGHAEQLVWGWDRIEVALPDLLRHEAYDGSH